MVIHKDGTKLYHRPGCPVIVDGTGVLAMTRAQAEGRGYKSHEDCDPANPQAKAPQPAAPAPVTVYVDGGKHYHRKDCRRLTDADAVKPAVLEVVGKEKWPCPVCRPPVRKRSTENAIPRTNVRDR